MRTVKIGKTTYEEIAMNRIELIADKSGKLNGAYTYDVLDSFGLIATSQKLKSGQWQLTWRNVINGSETFNSFAALKRYVKNDMPAELVAYLNRGRVR